MLAHLHHRQIREMARLGRFQDRLSLPNLPAIDETALVIETVGRRTGGLRNRNLSVYLVDLTYVIRIQQYSHRIEATHAPGKSSGQSRSMVVLALKRAACLYVGTLLCNTYEIETRGVILQQQFSYPRRLTRSDQPPSGSARRARAIIAIIFLILLHTYVGLDLHSLVNAVRYPGS